MSHFIVTSIGTYGDIFPFMQIAIALQQLGQKVTFITNPFFKETIEKKGLNFYPIGTRDQYMKVLMSKGLWSDKEHFDVVSSLFVPNLYGIDAYTSSLDPKEKVIILTQQNFLPNAGIAQAKRENLTIICGALYPSVFRTSPKEFRFAIFKLKGVLKQIAWHFISKGLDRQYIQSPLIQPLNAIRAANRMSPITSYQDLFKVVATKNALLFSSWFGDVHPEWPNNLIPGDFILNEEQDRENFPSELSEFLGAGEKPVLFTFGTGNMHAEKYIEASLEAIKITGIRAIFINKDRDQLPKPLPKNVFCLSHIDNFGELLRQCSLIVYHGGIGTLAEAARHGVPQLCIPSLGDQWDNAERIENIGLGGAIAIHELNHNTLTQKILAILHSDEIAAKCKLIQQQMSSRLSATDIAKQIIASMNN